MLLGVESDFDIGRWADCLGGGDDDWWAGVCESVHDGLVAEVSFGDDLVDFVWGDFCVVSGGYEIGGDVSVVFRDPGRVREYVGFLVEVDVEFHGCSLFCVFVFCSVLVVVWAVFVGGGCHVGNGLARCRFVVGG